MVSITTLGPNVNHVLRGKIVNCLGVNEVEDHGTYLGQPSLIGKAKKQIFDYIVEKTHKRVQSWKRRHMSIGG